MKKILIGLGVLLLAAVLVFVFHRFTYPYGGLDNYPYEPDTPEPDPHDGLFTSEHGTLLFNGDGETVEMDIDDELSGLIGLPAGRYKAEYCFLTGELPPHGSMPTRYDVAHELSLSADGKTVVVEVGIASEDGSTATVGTNMVTPDRIPFLFRDGNGKRFTVMFTKK